MKIFKSKVNIKSIHHLKRYFKFIKQFKEHKKIKYKTEAHHIYPKCYFPEFDSPNYIVNLPKRAHFIAHQMLALAIGGKMWQSFQLMGRLQKHKSRHYAHFKSEALKYNKDKAAKISISVSALWQNEDYRNHQIKQKKKHVPTEEHKQKISTALKGKRKPDGFRVGAKHSADTKKKLSESKIGLKNPSTKPITVFDDNDNPIVTILYKPLVFCKEHCMPIAILNTRNTNDKLYTREMRNCDLSRIKNQNYYRYKGWYVRLAKTP